MNNEENQQQNDEEFRDRETGYSDTMGALIASFGKNVVAAHRELQIENAEYIKTIAAMDNINWGVEVGILTLDQALTLLANIPIIAVVDTDPFVMDEATLDMEMKVSAHREDNSNLKVGTEVESNVKAGGMVGLVGVSAGLRIKADTTYQKETRRNSDYSSTVKAHIRMKRVPAPEGVQLIRETTNEVVTKAMEINKLLMERQVTEAKKELGDAEIPTQLPEGSLDTAQAGE